MSERIDSDKTQQDALVLAGSFIAKMRALRFFLAIDPRINRPRVHPLEQLTATQRAFLKDNREAVTEVLRLEALGEWSVLTPWDVRWKVG